MEVIDEVIGSQAPGPLPSFSRIHVLMVLDVLYRSGPMGRASLARAVGLGEGAIRTVLSRLCGAGLVEVSRRGCELTEEGRSLWSAIRSKLLRLGEIRNAPVEGGGFAYIVKGASRKVRLGVEQRDEAIRAGARGAITLVFKDGKLIMPGISDDVRADYPELSEEIMASAELGEGDVVIVAFADDSKKAEYGALAAALTLLE